MKILFYGDSITDASREKDREKELLTNNRFGHGYVMQAAGRLLLRDPAKYEIVNRGVSGNRIVDLYARGKRDLWNEQPDVISILIGINDIWHEINWQNGVELDRFERIYRMLLDETRARVPQAKIILMEPFVLHGSATDEHFEEFCAVYDYAAAVKKLAADYGAYFVPLQGVLSEKAAKYGAETMLRDGVHPAVGGAAVIADEWLKVFDKIEAEMEKKS